MTTLRYYQQDAVDALGNYLQTEAGNPAVVIPTGGGKTPVIATAAREIVLAGGRVLILSHVRELLEQARDTIIQWAPELRSQVGRRRVGVYSAGLRSRDTDHDCLIAGIQSVHRRACELGAIDLVIVDEAHLIPPEGDGMYRRFLDDIRVVNPDMRVVGLTATPYRLDSGTICGPGNILTQVVYEAGVRELIDAGYLCRLVSKAGDEVADTSSVRVRGGEFVEGEASDAMRQVLESACREIVALTGERAGVLIFAPGVEYARDVAACLASEGLVVGTVFGDTASDERRATINAFRSRQLRYLVNVGVLTTGFDARHVDCIAMLRPTLSPGLYYQMAGRGLRTCEGKADCLVLDFAGNVMRHGPVDAITAPEGKAGGAGVGLAPVKMCPECRELVPIAATRCECGYVWPVAEEAAHAPTAAVLPILSVPTVSEWKPVVRVSFERWTKRGDPDAAPTLRVSYWHSLIDRTSEWVCLQHDGFARDKAERWWRQRSLAAVPDLVDDGVRLACAGALAPVASVLCRKREGTRFEEVVGHDLGPVPTWPPAVMTDEETELLDEHLSTVADADEPPF